MDSTAVLLKRLDLFPKLTPESRRTTTEGGIISLVGILIAALLFISETIRVNQVSTLERLDLFQDNNANLTIHLEMTFFHLKCDEITLETSTASSGDARSTGAWSIQRLEKTPVLEKDEGCDVVAQVDIARYESGEMHVALSPHVLPQGSVGITLEEYFHFNSSHEIRTFQIGPKGSEIDSSTKPSTFERKTVPPHGTGRFIYEFNVVPESYLPLNARESKRTYGYQCREQDLITHSENEGLFALQRLGLPGVFITVRLSNLMVVKVESISTWTEYLISVLGIIAGTSALVAFVDSLLHHALWKAKLE